ncbi:hypothetical protein CDAR_385631 [Caerostris darwini]|uniref:Uncharacterized protein n=1 Tax=Caerostris darwini TaxID=1538125 RepID=A0AAV4M497_9ARAC|nr:hypothetical protein CDAR_385631 [Caerostris darwini]
MVGYLTVPRQLEVKMSILHLIAVAPEAPSPYYRHSLFCAPYALPFSVSGRPLLVREVRKKRKQGSQCIASGRGRWEKARPRVGEGLTLKAEGGRRGQLSATPTKFTRRPHK